MDWLFQGLIINSVWIILIFLWTLFKNAPINNKNDEDLYKIKLNFHVYLLSLSALSGIGFLSIILHFVSKEYFQALFCIVFIILAYYLTTNEFNKLFKMVASKNNKFNKKQKRAKKKTS